MKKSITVLAIATSLLLGSLALPMVARGAAIDDITNGVGQADPGSPTVDSAIATAINILSMLVGIAAVIMLIFGGYRYITSAGDPGNIAKAKSTILYALIGVAIVASTQLILKVTIGKAIKPVPTTPTTPVCPPVGPC